MYRFRECREAKGMSQKYVALTLGVKAPSVSDWEKGKTNPTLENLVSLSKLLGVTTDELLGVETNHLSVVSRNDNDARFSDDETELIMTLRQMNQESRERVLWFVRTLAGSPETQDVSSRKSRTSLK